MRTPRRVLVIGSGLAGLTAALQLAESKAVEVTLVSKAELGRVIPVMPRAALPRCCRNNQSALDVALEILYRPMSRTP